MNTKMLNIEVIRSVWRRVKKDIKVHDLKPVKDVKGGGGVKGESKPGTRGTGTTETTSTWHYVPISPKRRTEDWFVRRQSEMKHDLKNDMRRKAETYEFTNPPI